MNRLVPPHYLTVFFKPTTRSNWDLLTPIALLGLGIFGVAFIYSAQFSVQRLRCRGQRVQVREVVVPERVAMHEEHGNRERDPGNCDPAIPAQQRKHAFIDVIQR